jgi:uncharacterized RDD family membrane protein YckC
MTHPEPAPALDTDVLGRRVAAGLIDLLALFVLFVLVSVLLGESSAENGQASVNLSGGPFLLFLALVFLYYFVQELNGGRTLGKRLLGLKVVREDGSPAGAGPIAARTALRAVDGLFLYLVGLVVILATGHRRARVGDLVAGTRIVRG